MRLSTTLGEAYRNLRSGTARAALLAGLLTVTSVGAVVADATAIDALDARAREYAASGAAIRTASSEGQIDARSCDALNRDGGIPASGALREDQPFGIPALPGTSIPRFAVSPGFASILGVPTGAAPGALLSTELASTLGLRAGDTLPTDEGVLTVGGVFDWPDDGRDKRLARAIMVPTPIGKMDECWALVLPPTPERDALLRATASASPDSRKGLVLSQVNKSQGSRLDVAAEYEQRITRHLPLLAAAIAAGIAAGGVRLRRLELAAARHAGVGRTGLLAVIGAETLGWTTAAAIIAGGTIAAGTLLGLTVPEPVSAALTIAGATAAAVLGALAATLAVRERHLFRYFKNR